MHPRRDPREVKQEILRADLRRHQPKVQRILGWTSCCDPRGDGAPLRCTARIRAPSHRGIFRQFAENTHGDLRVQTHTKFMREWMVSILKRLRNRPKGPCALVGQATEPRDRQAIAVRPVPQKAYYYQTGDRLPGQGRPAPPLVWPEPRCPWLHWPSSTSRPRAPIPVSDRITEIAILHVEHGRVVERWSSLVNPGRTIPANIQSLIGITDEDGGGRTALPCAFAARSRDPLRLRLRGPTRSTTGSSSIGAGLQGRVLCTVMFSRALSRAPPHRPTR